MAGTNKRLAGPVAMANSATNIYNNSSSAITSTVRHIHIVNKTANNVSFSLFLGATGGSAAGTEIGGSGTVIPGNKAYDWYGALEMASTDFLTGLASAASSLTITVEGDQRVI
jgi:hypothetical protein